MGNTYNVATIINYCTNEYKFVNHCINEVKTFSEQVIVPVCDHFFDGISEDRELLDKTYNEHLNDAQFFEYKYDSDIFNNLQGCAVHGVSRLLGFNQINEDIEYILFIDADEIIDGARFKELLDKRNFKNYNAILFSNYWYFRDVKFRAKTIESSVLLIKKSVLSPEIILHERDRLGIFLSAPGNKMGRVNGIDGKPLAHHYSWVRTKDEMLRKVKTFGHKASRDWVSLVEKEFSHEFKNTDFVHGYEYEVVEPFIKL